MAGNFADLPPVEEGEEKGNNVHVQVPKGHTKVVVDVKPDAPLCVTLKRQ